MTRPSWAVRPVTIKVGKGGRIGTQPGKRRYLKRYKRWSKLGGSSGITGTDPARPGTPVRE